MKINYLRHLLLAVACLFAGLQAQAQFTGTYEEYQARSWGDKGVDFKFTEVATALQTDTATLVAAFNSWFAEGSTDPNMFFLKVGEELSDNYTQGSKGGFWVNKDGAPQAWGDDNSGLRWYNTIGWNTESDVFFINIGQYPEQCTPGDVFRPQFILKYGEKQVTFDLTITIAERPAFEIPEPTLKEASLQIVGEQEVVTEQYPRGGYDSDAVGTNIGQALELLGIADKKALVADNMDKLLFATVYNNGSVEEGGGMKKDSLSNASTAAAPGWWLRPVENAEGELTGEVSAAEWGGDDKFFIESFSYNAASDTLTCKLGQYPGTCKDDETWFANIYIIYGEKAYRIKYTLKVLAKEQGNGLADYTKVGEGSATVQQVPTDDYSTVSVNIDVEAIAAALGCEVSALGVYVLDDKDNFGESTANNGGWWLNNAGTVTTWGAGAAFYIEPPTANDWSVVNVGQYPNTLNVGDEVSGTLNFVNGTNYYPFTITLKIVEPQTVEQNFESVAARTFALQSLLDNDYTPMDLVTIPVEDIEAAIGTATPVFYGLAPDTLATQTGEVYSKKWSCDPKPGFWLAKDGRVSKWGGDSPVGICLIDHSTLRFFQYPNANSIGDVFTTQLFLVNEETSKMMTLNISLSFVETIQEKEVVGSETVLLPVVDGMMVPCDLTKPAEALGVTADVLLSPNNYCLRGLTSGGVYGEAANCENGLSFAADGGFDGYGDIFFTIEESDGSAVFFMGTNNGVTPDFNVDAQFCFEINDKQYVYYAKLLGSQAYQDGIETIATHRKDSKIYDLSGREIAKPVPGLYIQNGKKYVVK